MKDILWVLFEIGINLFQGLLISHYVYSILGDKEKRSFIKSGGLICGFVLTAVITLINCFLPFEGLYVCAYIAIVFVYALLRLKGKVLKKLFTSSFPIVFISIFTVLVANFFAVLFHMQVNDIFTNQSFERFISVVVCQLIILYIYKLTLGIFRHENKSDLSNHEWLLILAVLFISIAISILLTFVAMQEIPYNIRWLIVICILGIVVINIVTVYLVVNLSRKNSAVRENQLLRVQQKYQQQYLENAENQYETIRKLRHDFKNHNIVIASLLENGDFDKAKQYVSDYLDQLSVSGTFVNTDNNIVNAIINCKAEVAKSLDIETSIVTVSDFDGIDDLDLCSLISNMFDNAIDACRKVKENRQIHFSIKKDESNYTFCMKNSIEGSVIQNNPNLITTKKDKHLHGLETKIIKDIAKKYNGMADFFENDDFFICYIILKYL